VPATSAAPSALDGAKGANPEADKLPQQQQQQQQQTANTGEEEAEAEATNVLLVVLSGLPAAGKSSLCHAIAERLPQQSSELTQLLHTSKSTQLCVHHVCFDEVFFSSDQKAAAATTTEEKKKRKPTTTAFSPASWRGMRRHVLETLDTTQLPAWKKEEKHVFHIVLIDDNMYYRSMREVYRKLARRHRCAFAQLHVQCTLKSALGRNALRSGTARVPRATIERMHALMEPPRDAHVLPELPAYECVPWRRILGALRIPAVAAVIAEAKRATPQSRKHHADLQLRTLISQRMAALPKQHPNKREHAALLNRARKAILEQQQQQQWDNVTELFNRYIINAA
jgi:tRNA uridine 5-carbamoylmethylation protein Kti12